MKAKELKTVYAKVYYMGKNDINGNVYGFVYTHDRVYSITSWTCDPKMLLDYCYYGTEHFELKPEMVEYKKVSGRRELNKEFKRLSNK